MCPGAHHGRSEAPGEAQCQLSSPCATGSASTTASPSTPALCAGAPGGSWPSSMIRLPDAPSISWGAISAGPVPGSRPTTSFRHIGFGPIKGSYGTSLASTGSPVSSVSIGNPPAGHLLSGWRPVEAHKTYSYGMEELETEIRLKRAMARSRGECPHCGKPDGLHLPLCEVVRHPSRDTGSTSAKD